MGRKAFVIGHPVAHSRSPMMHGYWLAKYGIDGSYEKLDIAPENLGEFFKGFGRAGWSGGNVTVPHKLAVMEHCDRIDEAALAIGAVNTLWREDGDLVGGNTDWSGFLANLDELAPGWDDGAGLAVVLGAGGAARAAVYGLLKRGMAVAIVNRTVDKALELATQFGARCTGHAIGELQQLLSRCDLLVNTTSLGMKGQPPLEIDLGSLKPGAVVHDIVYVPLETDLLKQAKTLGHRTVDGLGMLLHQAVDGFEHWFGRRPEVTADLRSLLEADIRRAQGES